MMNFFKSEKEKRQEAIRKADQKIQLALDKTFNENYLKLKKQFTDAGLTSEEAEEKLKELKIETKLEMIKKFNESLKQRVEDRLKNIQKTHDIPSTSQSSANATTQNIALSTVTNIQASSNKK